MSKALELLAKLLNEDHDTDPEWGGQCSGGDCFFADEPSKETGSFHKPDCLWFAVEKELKDNGYQFILNNGKYPIKQWIKVE